MKKMFFIFILLVQFTATANDCNPLLQFSHSLESPGVTQWQAPRLFTDEQTRALIWQLVTVTGNPVGSIPIFDQSDELSRSIGYEAASKIRQFATDAANFIRTYHVPYPENMSLQFSPVQTFIRWNTSPQAVNDSPHIDETAITIIKREHEPERISGTRLFLNGREFVADPTKVIAFNGRYRWPRLVNNGYWWWYQPREGVLHGAGPSTGVWDFGIFLSLR